MNKLFVPFLPPWVETGLQPAFYDKESGTVLQQTARMYNKVNCLIRNFNQLSKETRETVEEYIEKFTELKDFVDNYFDNLDVQEEINNKLDAMAEAGTLQEIITTYIQSNVTWTFNTVADMKQATNLVAGSYAQTLGFHSINDGGGALYNITDTGTANEMDVIAVGSLYATLIDGNNAKQFGAYGDDTHDDTSYLQQAIDYVSAKKGKLVLKDGTYLIDAITSLLLKSDIELDFINAKLKAIPNDQTTYNVLSIVNAENCIINNAVIEGEKDDHTGAEGEFGYGVNIRGSSNIVFNNLTVSNCWGDGVFIHKTGSGTPYTYSENIFFNGYTRISNCRRQGVSIISGNNLFFDKVICTNIFGTDPSAGIDVEGNNSSDTVGNITINYLECNQTIKGFTMRNKGAIQGDIKIGSIYHCNPKARSDTGAYEQAFRLFFNYFEQNANQYTISVENITSDYNPIQLENLYNDITPKVIIGDVHAKVCRVINTATPGQLWRSFLPIRYTVQNAGSTSLGGLEIGSLVFDTVKSANGSSISNMSPISVYCDSGDDLTSLTFSNVRIGILEAIALSSEIGLDNNSNKSNVLWSNVRINTPNIHDIYERRDSGAFTCITSGGNTIYFMPASNSASNKIIQLRPRNSLQPLKLKCVGNSTVTINTAHQSTQFTGVNLNGATLTPENNIYTIGTFSSGAEFNISSNNGVISVEQVS